MKQPWLKALLIFMGGIVIVALALLTRSFLWGREEPVEAVVTPPPTPIEALTIEGLQPPEIKPEWERKVQAYYRYWAQTPSWIVEDVDVNGRKVHIEYWQLPVISTGKKGMATAILRDGRTFTLQVLYTLTSQVNSVFVLPVVIAASGDGGQINFVPNPQTTHPLGKAFLLSVDSPFANVQKGLDWEQCPFSSEWCDLGRATEMQWPGVARLVLRRILSQKPSGFVLYGVQVHSVPPPSPWVSSVVPDLSTWEVMP